MAERAPLHIVILAAGQGTRMRSALPKVLQPLAGQPMLAHVLDGARALSPAAIHVVVGHGAEAVQAAFADQQVTWVEQAEQLGTGHAVAQAMPGIPDGAQVLVLYGDVPLVTPDTLQRLLKAAAGGCAVLSVRAADPTGYGRILRGQGDGRVAGIVEHKDASDSERAISEINTGLLAADAQRLRAWLGALGNDNAQGEYYLTDIVAMAAADGEPAAAVVAGSESEVAGVNNRAQLAVAEREVQRRQAAALLASGVTLADPARIDVRGQVVAGRDVFIDINAVLEGTVTLGDNVHIGPGCHLKDVQLGDGTQVHAHCVLEDAVVGADCSIGPFARLRPGTRLKGSNRIGNFVETKKAVLDEGAKAGHLAYLGDATVGKRVNISAGVITCNYDGANKHPTVIGDDAFVGTDSQLVAPVTLGDRAYIAAGSTITKDAPGDALTICRARGQKSLPGWKQPTKDSE